MGKMQERQLAIAPAPVSLVASAARIRGGASLGIIPRNSGDDGWHIEAWDHYHHLGEFRYACDWLGGMLSKATIYGTVETTEGVVRVDTGRIVELLSELFGNADGRAEMLRLIGIHMSVTGDCHIVGYPDPDEFSDGSDKWEVAASTKVIRPATATDWWTVNDVSLKDVDPDTVLAIRIWRPDPLDPQKSISPARSILRDLRQLRKLSDYLSAQLDSRLAGAGVLLMPDNMSLPPAPVKEGEQAPVRSANNAEELMAILMEAMTRSLNDRDHASSMVPIVVTASAEAIAAVKHMTFWSELDAHATELRKEVIGRLALGMDVPPEVLQGSSDSNHWSAWQADESAIKAHAEPLLKIITTALGSHYLRPLIKDEPEYAGQRLSAFSVAADTSEMRLRPNRSKEALELYNLGELSGPALRRETGFDETDAMDEKQKAAWLTQKVASGSTTPELVEAALRELGVNLKVVHDTQAPVSIRELVQPEGTQGRPAPSLQDHPTQDIPDQQVSERRKQAREEGRVPSADVERKAALIAASEQIVFRALERAGNRLKSKMQVKTTCGAADIYKFVDAATDTEDLLQDAWGYVPAVAVRAHVNAQHMTSILSDYTTELLETQQAHSIDRLTRHVTRALEDLGQAA
ncbi:portal protein [Arthrobacter phage BruhMoment]|nr:portal protein [Arthrobacter phage BruhMoment]